jgi:antitoxin HigA-1
MKSLRDRRRKPTHPGAILREDVLPALRMSQVELASRLGVSRVTVNTLLQEKRDLSIELAARIAKLLGHSPESWIRMQEALDLWKLAQDPSRLKGIEPLPPSRIAASVQTPLVRASREHRVSCGASLIRHSSESGNPVSCSQTPLGPRWGPPSNA